GYPRVSGEDAPADRREGFTFTRIAHGRPPFRRTFFPTVTLAAPGRGGGHAAYGGTGARPSGWRWSHAGTRGPGRYARLRYSRRAPGGRAVEVRTGLGPAGGLGSLADEGPDHARLARPLQRG